MWVTMDIIEFQGCWLEFMRVYEGLWKFMEVYGSLKIWIVGGFISAWYIYGMFMGICELVRIYGSL